MRFWDFPIQTLSRVIFLFEVINGHPRFNVAFPYIIETDGRSVTGAIGYNDGIKTSTGISSIRIQNPTLNVSNTQEPPAIRKTENQLLWESVAEPDVYIDDSMDRVTGSFSPVTTDLTTDATLDVVLDIDEHLVGIPFQLCGDLGENLNVICNTTIHYFQAIGPRTISVSVLPSWRSTTFPWGLAGDVIWRVYIKPTMQSITITTTRLEIYGLAAALPSFFANQVSVAFLRTLVLPARKSGETDWTWYVIRELSETYGRLRFQYDARWGAPHFDVGPYGGNFELGLWTRRCTIRNAPINCYDLAGILQIAVGLAPEVKCAWKFMAPFGYLLQTNLIGVGCCNNPFYQSNNTTPIIGNNDVRRTAFGNHAFLSITSDAKHIADACAGPHVVSEDLQGYIKAAIQEAGTGPGQTTLYDEWWNYPGTVADVVSATGITSINARSLLMEDLEAIQPSIAIMNAMDMAAKGSEVGSKIEITNLDIPIVEGLLVARAGMKLLDRHHEVSAGGSELNWLLDSEPYPTEIKIAVLASALHAQVYFQNELGKYERPLEHVFSSPPTDIRKGHLCLTSSGAVETHSVMTWTHGNVFVCIAAPLSLRNLDVVYAAPLAEYMWNRESNALQSPTLLRLEAPVGNVTVGQEFMIKAIVGFLKLFGGHPNMKCLCFADDLRGLNRLIAVPKLQCGPRMAVQFCSLKIQQHFLSTYVPNDRVQITCFLLLPMGQLGRSLLGSWR